MDNKPKLFKYVFNEETMICGRMRKEMYGAYFPTTDLLIYETGQRYTGMPNVCPVYAKFEWITNQ